MGKTQNWIVIVVIVISLLLGISIAFRSQTAVMQFFSVDDAFYYFQVAKNIAAGNGITFDGFARGNGYHPLWMALCVPVFALAKLDLWLPLRVLIVLQSLIHTGAGFLIYRLLSRKIAHPLSLLAMTVWLFSPSIFMQSGSAGLETGINIICITALLYSLSLWSDLEDDQNLVKKYWITGIFAALTLLARLDNIYLLCFLGAWLVLKNTLLNRKWVFNDFLLTAVGVIFSYVVYVGITPFYYGMISQIKIILVSSLVIFPVGQFAVGNYHEDAPNLSRKVIIFRTLFAVLFSAVIEFALMLILFSNTGYSKAAFILQVIFFTGATTLLKVISSGKDAEVKTAILSVDFHWLKAVKWKKLISQGIAYFLPVFSTLGIFMIFNHFYFGSAMPLSGKIKSWWGTLSTVYGEPASTITSFLGLNENGPWFVVGQFIKPISSRFSQSSYLYLLLFGLLFGIVFLFVMRTKSLQNAFSFYSFEPFALGVLFHAAYYTMTGYVGYRSWYWAIENLFVLLFFTLLIAVLVEIIADKISFLQKPSFAWGFVSFVSLFLLGVFVRFNLSYYPVRQDNTSLIYLQNTHLLEEVTQSGSVIGMTGGGVEAYFISDRTVVNLDGLINGVEYYDALTHMRLNEYLDQIGVDYVLGKEFVLLNSEPYMIPLKGRLELLDIPDIEFDDYMRLYRYLSEQ